MNLEEKAFVIHIVLLEVQNIVHLSYRTQIALLITNKIPVVIPGEYVEYTDIFSKKFTVELPKYMRINNHSIDLEKGKQLLYRLIYNLELVKLETLKIYIKENLKNGFIRSLKSPAGICILIVKKTNCFL